METVFEYTQHNILVIPQSLYYMEDVSLLKQSRDSVIFYKCLKDNLEDIEFYTNHPCFVYIESGSEIITNADNKTIHLQSGMGIFLSKGLSLHSDFVKKSQSLKAYLIFFDERIIIDYMAKVKVDNRCIESHHRDFFTIQDFENEFTHYIHSLQLEIQDSAYFDAKLQELLCLIAWKGHQGDLIQLLSASDRSSSKRNLTRLLENQDILHLTVNDLAHISGRSVSSFNRDFKAIYHTSPKKWLHNKKMCYAKELLEQQKLSVTEVALEVGYESLSSFIAAFKLKYGVTPKKINLAK